MNFEKFPNSGEGNEKKDEIGELAAKISQETGLDENGLVWALGEIGAGATAELDQTIAYYKLGPILDRPDVLALAKKGLALAEKEDRESAVSVMKSIFKL